MHEVKARGKSKWVHTGETEFKDKNTGAIKERRESKLDMIAVSKQLVDTGAVLENDTNVSGVDGLDIDATDHRMLSTKLNLQIEHRQLQQPMGDSYKESATHKDFEGSEGLHEECES